jgi:tetratricopeptide (TPR) repeat protein
MSRFNNLEFNEHHDREQRQEPLVKDEAYYLQEADGAFTQGRFEEALRAYSKVLEYNPRNAGAWTSQVRMLIELEEYHEASVWADKALEMFPREPELLAAKSVALARQGDLKNALAFSDAALEERGNTPYVWLARGDVLLAREERRADYCFDKALALEPHRWLSHWLAARIYFYYEKFTLALKVIEQALAFETGECMVWYQRGACQQALGLTAAAGHSYEQARQLNPRCLVAVFALNELSHPGLKTRWRGFWRRIFRS